MAPHRVHPQSQVTRVSSLSIANEVPSGLNHKKDLGFLPALAGSILETSRDSDVWLPMKLKESTPLTQVSIHLPDHCWPPTQRCLLISCVVILMLAVVAALIGLGITFGMPVEPAELMYRQCKTASQHLGFLCEDLTTCLPPSLLCNGKVDCSYGEDESATYCGQIPTSLPQNLIFKCPNQKTWTYVDKVCDAKNDCGDCSDESVSQCPKCSGWTCDTVFFMDCACIPRTRCKNGIQDCADWSDENLCNY